MQLQLLSLIFYLTRNQTIQAHDMHHTFQFNILIANYSLMRGLFCFRIFKVVEKCCYQNLLNDKCLAADLCNEYWNGIDVSTINISKWHAHRDALAVDMEQAAISLHQYFSNGLFHPSCISPVETVLRLHTHTHHPIISCALCCYEPVLKNKPNPSVQYMIQHRV